MKKTTLSLALATALFTSMTLLNCSKKEEPAPATTTTTAGTTTTGTTTTGTSTSGTTTSGTTTSGTTTSTTTSGSTTADPNIRETGISGTFSVDGVSQTIVGKAIIMENKTTYILFESENYRFGIMIGTQALQDGTYSIDNYSAVVSGQGPGAAGVVVMPLKPYTGAQFWSFKESAGSVSVLVLGKKITVNTVNLIQYNDTNKKVTGSCSITLN